MPADQTVMWVYRAHDSYPYLKPNTWQWIPDADRAALILAGCVDNIKTHPARHLTPVVNDPVPAG